MPRHAMMGDDGRWRGTARDEALQPPQPLLACRQPHTLEHLALSDALLPSLLPPGRQEHSAPPPLNGSNRPGTYSQSVDPPAYTTISSTPSSATRLRSATGHIAQDNAHGAWCVCQWCSCV